MTLKTQNPSNSKFYKYRDVIISNMIPGDPTGSPDESFFNISSPQYDERNAGLPILQHSKLFKQVVLTTISSLRIVNMLPGDRNGLPDAFYTHLFLDNLGGIY